MKLKAVSGIMLTLLLIGMLILTSDIQPVKSDWTWTETIYIKTDGSVDPDTAPISTVDNITYTLTDNIVGDVPEDSSAIIVERDNIVVDGASYTIQGTRAYRSKGIDLAGRSNVTIKNTEIKLLMYGTWLCMSSNVVISGNTMKHNWYGIELYESSNNSVSGNNITNSIHGISFDRSPNNVLSGNNITNNVDGIILCCSSNNTLGNNDASNNGYNFDVYGSLLSHYIQDVDASNTVDGKPIYYWINRRDIAVPLDAGYVTLINCTNITVKNLNLTNNGSGVLLASTTNSTITKNNIRANSWGGIGFRYSSNYNSITGNNITQCVYACVLGESSNNVISGNNITNNGFGIYLNWFSNNTISENSIAGGLEGIHFEYSSNNIISGNNMTNNSKGIRLAKSSSNIFCHNNFIDNQKQVYLYESFYNVWDDCYPSGGNYWSDHTDVDQYSGPYQNETGSDGIWDHSYIIDENNQDNYPLMGMFSDFNATSEYHVQTICNSTISDFQFNGTAISFNATGENETAGFCRMCVPTALMSDPYKVFVNGTEVSYDLLPCSNSTHSYLYFTYNHSTQEVIVIPEFPSFLILPLFMIATLLAVTVYRRKHSM
jgi:parallel beta-helix repeat protein